MNFLATFYGWSSTVSKLQSYYEETVYFLLLSTTKFLVLIWSTLESLKAASTLESSSGFELKTLDWESSALTTTPLFLHLVNNFTKKSPLSSFTITYIDFEIRVVLTVPLITIEHLYQSQCQIKCHSQDFVFILKSRKVIDNTMLFIPYYVKQKHINC